MYSNKTWTGWAINEFLKVISSNFFFLFLYTVNRSIRCDGIYWVIKSPFFFLSTWLLSTPLCEPFWISRFPLLQGSLGFQFLRPLHINRNLIVFKSYVFVFWSVFLVISLNANIFVFFYFIIDPFVIGHFFWIFRAQSVPHCCCDINFVLSMGAEAH